MSLSPSPSTMPGSRSAGFSVAAPLRRPRCCLPCRRPDHGPASFPPPVPPLQLSEHRHARVHPGAERRCPLCQGIVFLICSSFPSSVAHFSPSHHLLSLLPITFDLSFPSPSISSSHHILSLLPITFSSPALLPLSPSKSSFPRCTAVTLTLQFLLQTHIVSPDPPQLLQSLTHRVSLPCFFALP